MKTRRIFKIAGFLVLVFFTAIVWMAPGIADAADFGAVRLIAALGTVASAIYLAMSSPDDPGYKVRQLEVIPADDANCPFCGTPLFSAHPDCYCPSCQVKRL